MINNELSTVIEKCKANNKPPQDPTQDKSKAYAAFEEAEKLRKKPSAESLKLAIEKYSEALRLFRAEGDRESEATTLATMGLVYSSLGDKPKAIQLYEQALPIFKFVGN